jgi:short-subunit dehydrogenase
MTEYSLITGASGGIGYYFAHELAKRKHNVIIVARSQDKLQKLKEELISRYKVKCELLALDLSMSDAANQLHNWCKQNNYEVNILINNAGYGLFGYFDNGKIEDVTNMMQLNMNALVELCHAFLPMLKSKSKSYIMNVASTAAYQAVPGLTTYAATKAFVVLFTRGLRYELRNTSVSVSCLSPGATATGFVERAGLQAIQERADKFSMKAEDVARIAIAEMFKGNAEIIPGWLNKISSQLTGWVPKSLTEKIAADLYKEALK